MMSTKFDELKLDEHKPQVWVNGWPTIASIVRSLIFSSSWLALAAECEQSSNGQGQSPEQSSKNFHGSCISEEMQYALLPKSALLSVPRLGCLMMYCNFAVFGKGLLLGTLSNNSHAPQDMVEGRAAHATEMWHKAKRQPYNLIPAVQ